MDFITFNYEPFILFFIALLSFSGSYTSIQLFHQTGGNHKFPRLKKWFSPVLLGLTIWSIQYVSVIRYDNPIYYNQLYFIIGFVVAAGGCFLAYHMINSTEFKWRAVTGSAVVFTGTMKFVHIIAVYSMWNVQVDIKWEIVFLSLAIPFLISLAAFYFIFDGLKASTNIFRSTSSLGLGMLVMNYLCLKSIILWSSPGAVQSAFLMTERETFILVSIAASILIVTGFIFQMLSNQRMRREQDIKQIRLHSLFHQNPFAIYALDSRGRIVNCNPAAEKITGYPLEELINKSYRAFVPKKYHKGALTNFFSTLRGNTAEFQTKIISGINDELTIKVKSFPIVYQENIIGVYAIIQDITENVHLKLQLSEKENHYRLVSEFSRELILLMDSSGHTKFVSPSHFNTLGYQEEELLQYNALSLIHPEDREKAERTFETIKKTCRPSNEIFRYKMKSGDYIYLESSVVPIIESGEQYYLVTSREITERIELEEKLRYLAYHDSLTHIPNRGYFSSRLEEKIKEFSEETGGFSVMILDFDRFKWVNDTFGHDTGDQLLIDFVARVKDNIDTNEFFARLGGDEFALILPCNNKEHIKSRSDKLLKALQKTWKIKQHEFITTSSIGIARYPMDGRDFKSILAHADQALYHAKSKGRNTFSFYTSIIEETYSRRTTIENGLRVALEQNHFFLVYQPQIHVQTNEIAGVEVLLRYVHPVLGMISPAEFIPLCENNGMIDDVTHWVIKKALEQQNSWTEEGMPRMKMAINISPSTIVNSSFAQVLNKYFKAWNVSSEYIELEITEDVFFEYSSQTLQTLTELEKMGIKLALDDFGSGYSSLRQMKELPLHKIKIDKVFIDHVELDRDRAFLDSILDLTKKLESTVVCEGVESKKQVDYLVSKGDIIAQGYYYSKPLTSCEFKFWYENHSMQYAISH
jgi:diguanylate cyclase (GGDEF)-like protein/PAS domain S-box-containing protein